MCSICDWWQIQTEPNTFIWLTFFRAVWLASYFTRGQLQARNHFIQSRRRPAEPLHCLKLPTSGCWCDAVVVVVQGMWCRKKTSFSLAVAIYDYMDKRESIIYFKVHALKSTWKKPFINRRIRTNPNPNPWAHFTVVYRTSDVIMYLMIVCGSIVKLIKMCFVAFVVVFLFRCLLCAGCTVELRLFREGWTGRRFESLWPYLFYLATGEWIGSILPVILRFCLVFYPDTAVPTLSTVSRPFSGIVPAGWRP